jgi:DMSO/TMAO reductase YedYZ molybdopterin-dependent catalytic subunit
VINRLVLYQQSVRSTPQIHLHHWSFAITGGVRHPLILSYDDLLSFPTQTIRAATVCAGVSQDRPLIGEAVWRGIALQTLLDELEIAPQMRFARIHAADGYSTVLPIDRLANTLIAYEMDSEALAPEHGFPARLIAPGLFGHKMPKWIERIELRDSSEGGFWESRGYSLEGDATIKVGIFSHEQNANGSIRLTGAAYSGIRPIRSVNVSIDGGDAMPIAFRQDDPFALAHWHIDWTPPGAGDYHVSVSAKDKANRYADHRLVVKVR